MKAQILTGSRSEIAEMMVHIDGKIHEVIVFVEESSDSGVEQSLEDIFIEMEPFTVKAGGADYSRESMYAPLEGD